MKEKYKKTVLMHLMDKIMFTPLALLLLSCIYGALSWVHSTIKDWNIPLLNNSIEQGIAYIQIAIWIVIGVFIFLLAIIIIDRKKNSHSLSSILKSIKETYKFRSFMRMTNTDTLSEAEKQYNKIVRKSFVDYFDDKVVVYIPLPTNIGTRRIVNNNMSEINEYIKTEFDYMNFSQHQAKNGAYWIEGEISQM